MKVTDLAESKTIGGAVVHWFASRLSRIQEARKDERGFTLIELLVVITLPFHKRLYPLGLRPNSLPAPHQAVQRR